MENIDLRTGGMLIGNVGSIMDAFHFLQKKQVSD
jgi:hypothetical protein